MYLRPQKKREQRMLTIQGFVGRLFESLDEVKKQGTSSINSKQFLVPPLASCSEITRLIDLLFMRDGVFYRIVRFLEWCRLHFLQHNSSHFYVKPFCLTTNTSVILFSSSSFQQHSWSLARPKHMSWKFYTASMQCIQLFRIKISNFDQLSNWVTDWQISCCHFVVKYILRFCRFCKQISSVEKDETNQFSYWSPKPPNIIEWWGQNFCMDMIWEFLIPFSLCRKRQKNSWDRLVTFLGHPVWQKMKQSSFS